jgi:hypothetical protein
MYHVGAPPAAIIPTDALTTPDGKTVTYSGKKMAVSFGAK